MTLKEIGASIYLCEGTKEYLNRFGSPKRRIEVCNSNPLVIKLFLKYLRTYNIDEGKLKGRCSLHDGDNEDNIKKYWSKVSGIPLKQITKSTWKKKGKKKKRLPYGTFTIRYGDAQLFLKIFDDINEVFG